MAKEGGTKVGNFLRNTFGKQTETTTSTDLTSTTITGSKDNGGIITGDRTKDVVTPSVEVPDRNRGGGGTKEYVYIDIDTVNKNTTPPPRTGGGNVLGGVQTQRTQRDLRKENRQNIRETRKELMNQGYNRYDANKLARGYNNSTYGSASGRTPTLDELKRQGELDKNILTVDLDRLENKNVETNKVVNQLTSLSSENEKVVKNIDEIDKIIEKEYGDKIITDAEGNKIFTGTEKEYKEYQTYERGRDMEYEKYTKIQDKLDISNQKLESLGGKIDSEGYIREPTIGVGYKVGGGSARQEPISNFYFSKDTPITNVGKAIDIVGKTTFATSGAGYRDIINTIGKNKSKDVYGNVILRETQNKSYNTYLPMTGSVQLDAQGKPITRREVTGNYFIPRVTSQDVEDRIYNVGSKTVEYGKYAVPYAGQTLFFGEVGEKVIGSGKKVGQYIKENPVETALVGASLILPASIYGKRYLTKVTGREVEGGIRYSSKAQDIFGKVIRVDKTGVKVLPSQRYGYEVIRKEIVPSESRDFLGKVVKEKPNKLDVGGGSLEVSKDIEEVVYDIFGNARTVKKGYKTIVQTPDKVLFSGSPFGKVGKAEREKTLEFLKDKGWKEADIKKAIRLRQPEVIDYNFLGKGQQKVINGKELFEVKGALTSTPSSIVKEGIPTRLREGQIKFIRETTNPLEIKGLEDNTIIYIDKYGKQLKLDKGIKLFESSGVSQLSYLTKEGKPYSKLSQAGKTKELDKSFTVSREIQPNELPNVKGGLVRNKKGIYSLELNAPQFELLGEKSFGIYKDVSLSRTIMPNVKKVQSSKGIVLVEKEIPDVAEEGLGFTQFQGSGKTSSQEYFKSLYSNEQVASTVLKVEKRIPTIKATIIKPTPILELESEAPLMVGGSGKASSIYAGTNQYERTEELGTISRPSVSSNSLIDVKSEIKTTSILKTFSGNKEKIKPKVNLGLGESNIVASKENIAFKEVQRENQQLRQQQRLEQQSKQVQRLAQAFKQVQVSKQVMKPVGNIKFKIKSEPVLKKLKKQLSDEDFEAFGIRYGKPTSLGKFESKGQASKELGEFLTGTLGASGFLTKGKEKLKAEETGLLEDFGFRKSKTGSKFLVVEEKEKRLRRGGTGKDIQYFR